MPAFLALDLGTSFIKAAVLDLDRLRLSHVQRIPFPDPLPNLPTRHCEIEPAAVIGATRSLLDRLLDLAPADCRGLVMCSQMQGLVVTDAGGRPLSNCITWRDQRALTPHPSGEGTYFDLLVQRISHGQRRCLGELHAGLPVAVLFTLAEQGQLPPDATAASLPDFVLASLCQTTEPAGVEATNASVHGPLDLAAMAWQRDMLAAWGLDGLAWPRIRRAGDVVGHLKAGRRSLPCYAPIGDQPCSLVGALLAEDELSINISTGSQVSRISPRLVRGDYQTRPFFDGQYLYLITHIPAGRALNVLVTLLTELAEAEGVRLADPWGTLARAAEATGPTDLQANLAFFASAAGDRGAITNIREDNLTAGHLFRAAFQRMADDYHACALRLSPGHTWQRLVFSGGLAQKLGVLRQVICERFGAEHRLCPTNEDALWGLLALALVCSGRAETMAAAVGLLAAKDVEAPGTCEASAT